MKETVSLFAGSTLAKQCIVLSISIRAAAVRMRSKELLFYREDNQMLAMSVSFANCIQNIEAGSSFFYSNRGL